MKAYVCVGVGASGKSTYANLLTKKNHLREINRDELRKRYSLQVLRREFSWHTWDFSHEQEITSMRYQELSKYCRVGTDIIVSDTNLVPAYREELIKFLESYGYSIEYLIFDVNLSTAIERDRQRVLTIGEEIIKKQYEQLLVAKIDLANQYHPVTFVKQEL